MRVADRTLAQNFLTTINRTKEDVQNLQIQLASGSKINKPSDDPTGIWRSLKLNEKMANNDTYKSNVETSLSFLGTTTSAMESILGEIEDVETSFTDIQNPVNRGSYATIGQKIEHVLKSILSTSNTEFEGKYIFGGTDYTQTPFDFNAAGTAIIQKTNNNSGEQLVRISSSFVQKVNITGDELFGSMPSSTDPITGNETDIFNTLLRISNGLKAGNAPSSADTKIVKDFRTHLLDKTTNAGEIVTKLQNTSDLLDSQSLELENLLYTEMKVDPAKAITELQNQQYYMELSYKMASMILPQSLLDFL